MKQEHMGEVERDEREPDRLQRMAESVAAALGEPAFTVKASRQGDGDPTPLDEKVDALTFDV